MWIHVQWSRLDVKMLAGLGLGSVFLNMFFDIKHVKMKGNSNSEDETNKSESTHTKKKGIQMTKS